MAKLCRFLYKFQSIKNIVDFSYFYFKAPLTIEWNVLNLNHKCFIVQQENYSGRKVAVSMRPSYYDIIHIMPATCLLFYLCLES